uniref:Uncharacterized protein n=1 Tax=Myoviridae sp. ctXVO17 TaxID=2825121 RepID=A0A8S5P4B6_9CAUD|nr:MAG TPA: hypothetical protein [Myoviridae sp. ctXVO17]
MIPIVLLSISSNLFSSSFRLILHIGAPHQYI